MIVLSVADQLYPRQAIGIYRTVFPLYPETFIREQIRSLSRYQPVVICRDLVEQDESVPTVTIEKPFRGFHRFSFTSLGFIGGFRNIGQLGPLGLIHAHFAADAALALPLAQSLRIPLVVTCHGSDVTTRDFHIAREGKISGYRYLLGKQALFDYGSRFIAVSDFLKKKMIDVGYPAGKVVRHYIGVDTERFAPRQGSSSPVGNASYILSIGRHTEVKGIDLLLRAFAIVARNNPTLRLVQIGGGALTPALKALSRELNIENSVSFLGVLRSSEVLPYVQHCIGLVLSSRKAPSGAEEAFGLVLAEASACGVPCIGTKVGGIPEAIIDSETGLLAEPEDVKDLAEKIGIIVSNPDVSRSMGRRGREFVCDTFDIRKQTQILESMYDELL